MPQPDVFLCSLNVMDTSPTKNGKTSSSTFFRCIIYIKTNWNSLGILRNNFFFKRQHISFLNASNFHYFRTLKPRHGGILVVTKPLFYALFMCLDFLIHDRLIQVCIFLLILSFVVGFLSVLSWTRCHLYRLYIACVIVVYKGARRFVILLSLYKNYF